MDYIRTDAISDKCTDEEISEGFSEPQGSVLWSKRSFLYRFSFIALVPLFAVFLLGFSSPFWMKKHQVDKYRGYNIRETVDVSVGIWRVCEGSDFSDITDCTAIPDLTNYIVVCQTMLSLCLIFIVLSLIFGIYENCATRYDIDEGSEVRTKRPEMNAVIAGLFGLTGISMYATSIIEAMRHGDGMVHWAFVVTAASVLGVIVCGIIMAIVNPVHSTVETFPGINLSRQNSLKSRSPTIQDRLVNSAECVIQINGTQTSGTTYGVTDNNFDLKEVTLLPRSESSLTSNVSTPDVLLKTSHESGLCNSNRSIHVVESRDIHARLNDPLRQIELHQQQKRAANSRSGQCDANVEYDVANDLYDTTFDDILTSDASSYSDNENFKLLEPLPRGDKHVSVINSESRALGQTLKLRPNEPVDLMVLDELVTTNVKGHMSGAVTEETLLEKRTFNPFLEDTAISLPHVVNELQRSIVSNGSWENQPWPDPPSEHEILDQPLLLVPTNKSSTADVTASSCSEPQLRNSTERLQCQPHNLTAHYKKLTHNDDSNIPNITMNSVGSKSNSSKGNQIKPSRKPADKKSASPNKTLAAVRKDYDNPLFESQLPDGDKSGNTEINLSFQISQSSELVHPSSGKSAIPSYTAIDPTHGKSESSNYMAFLDNNRQMPEDSEGRQSDANRPPQGQSCKTSSPKLNQTGKKSKDDITSSLLNETPSVKKEQHRLINGVVKSRSQTLRDEQQKKRSEQLSSGPPQQQHPPSKKQGQNDKSPQVGSKLPRPSSHKNNTPESKDSSLRSPDEAAGRSKTSIPEKHKQHDSKNSKQHKKK